MRLTALTLVAAFLLDPAFANALTAPASSPAATLHLDRWKSEALSAPSQYELSPLGPVFFDLTHKSPGNYVLPFSVKTTESYRRNEPLHIPPTPEYLIKMRATRVEIRNYAENKLHFTMESVPLTLVRHLRALSVYDSQKIIFQDMLAFENPLFRVLSAYHEWLHAKLDRIRGDKSIESLYRRADEIAIVFEEIRFYFSRPIALQKKIHLLDPYLINHSDYLALLDKMRPRIQGSASDSFEVIRQYLHVKNDPDLVPAVVEGIRILHEPEALPGAMEIVPLQTSLVEHRPVEIPDSMSNEDLVAVSPYTAVRTHLEQLSSLNFDKEALFLAGLLLGHLMTLDKENHKRNEQLWWTDYPHAKAHMSWPDLLDFREFLTHLIRLYQKAEKSPEEVPLAKKLKFTLDGMPEKEMRLPRRGSASTRKTTYSVRLIDHGVQTKWNSRRVDIGITGAPVAEQLMAHARNVMIHTVRLPHTYNWTLLINGNVPDTRHLGNGIPVSEQSMITIQLMMPVTITERMEIYHDIKKKTKDLKYAEKIFEKLTEGQLIIGIPAKEILTLIHEIRTLPTAHNHRRRVVVVMDDVFFTGGPLAIRFRPETAKSPVPILEVAPEWTMAQRIEQEAKDAQDPTTMLPDSFFMQSLTGSWGGPAMFLVLMPLLEELGRVWALADSSLLANALWLISYAFLHAAAHVAIDLKEGGWSLFKARFRKRVGLSLLFSFSASIGLFLGYLRGFDVFDLKQMAWIFGYLPHFFYNLNVSNKGKGLMMAA